MLLPQNCCCPPTGYILPFTWSRKLPISLATCVVWGKLNQLCGSVPAFLKNMIPGVEIPNTACPGHSLCSANGTAGTLIVTCIFVRTTRALQGGSVGAVRPRQGWLQRSHGPMPCKPFLGYLVKSRGIFLCEQALWLGLLGSPGGQPPPGQAQGRFTTGS